MRKGADPMGLTIGSLPKLPDALVRNSWVKEVDVSNPGGARPDLPAGVKLEPSVRPGQVLDRVDWDSAVPLDPQFGENIAYRPDSPFLRNGRQDFTVFSGGDVSEAARELAALMTEYPAGVALTLDGLSQGQLADLVGGIGRKLDSAFAAGEVSEQEYADLNRGLDAYAEFMTEKAERERASFAVMKQTAAATKAQLRSGASEEDMADCAEQVRETWQEKLRAYLAENSYDRTALRQMIAAIRAGERLSVRLPPDAPPEKAARETASLRGAGTGAEISRMFYRDGSASLALPEIPEDAAQEAADFSMGKSVSVSVYYSPEAKRNQAWNRMSQERNTLIEQMKAEISAAGMDYFESQRFIKDSFTALYTDWMHNEPELFKVWFDWNEEDLANHAWDLTTKPEGWTDADFAFWKAYDPWGLEP